MSFSLHVGMYFSFRISTFGLAITVVKLANRLGMAGETIRYFEPWRPDWRCMYRELGRCRDMLYALLRRLRCGIIHLRFLNSCLIKTMLYRELEACKIDLRFRISSSSESWSMECGV